MTTFTHLGDNTHNEICVSITEEHHMEKIDRRIIKSQNAIQSAFIEMLIEDGFDEITVKHYRKSEHRKKNFLPTLPR